MKRVAFNDFRLALALLVLAAVAVDLLLPSPRCKDSGFDQGMVSESKAPGACVPALASTGLREP